MKKGKSDKTKKLSDENRFSLFPPVSGIQ